MAQTFTMLGGPHDGATFTTQERHSPEMILLSQDRQLSRYVIDVASPDRFKFLSPDFKTESLRRFEEWWLGFADTIANQDPSLRDHMRKVAQSAWLAAIEDF